MSEEPIDDGNTATQPRAQGSRSCFRKDDRIPFELALKEAPNNGDSPFIEAIKSLICAESWVSQMTAYEEALFHWQGEALSVTTHDSTDARAIPQPPTPPPILPGLPFNDTDLAQVDPESSLSHDDQMEVCQKFQECLRLNAREEFFDLLLENLPLFIRAATAYLSCLGDNFAALVSSRPLPAVSSSATPAVPATTTHHPRSEPNRSRPISPVNEPPSGVPLRAVQLPPADARLCVALAPPRGAKEQQLGLINERICADRRYRALDYMPSERQTCLTSHLDLLLPQRAPSPTYFEPTYQHTAMQRHYSCSSVDQNNHNQHHPQQQPPLTFPLPHCPAYQTGRCMDVVFANHCNVTAGGAAAATCFTSTQNSFSTHLTCLLGHADKQLSVAVCAICTDVLAASAGISLFRAAGFTPDGVASPGGLLASTSSASSSTSSMTPPPSSSLLPPRPTQRLGTVWPLASTLISSTDRLAADTMTSPIFGTVLATFLSHHEVGHAVVFFFFHSLLCVIQTGLFVKHIFV